MWGAFSRASSSIPSEKSAPTTSPDDPTRCSSSIARSPVPVATSRTRSPEPTAARSAARSRQRWCRPTVITEFSRSYTRAMRSNIARTWSSGRVPPRAAATPPSVMGRTGLALPERAQEVDQLVELLGVLLAQLLERRHGRSRVDQRAGDGLAGQTRADGRQLRSRPVVAVLADLVAAKTARRCGHGAALLVLGRDLHVDLARRPRQRTLDREVGHRGDHGDPGERGDRAPEWMPLGVAVDEREQDEEDHADGRDPHGRHEHERRRLDHAQQLEQEEEVPLRSRRVGGRGGVRLRAELGAEDDRHRDDDDEGERGHRPVLKDGVGEERLPPALHDVVLAEVLLLLARVHGGWPRSLPWPARAPSPPSSTAAR